MIAKNDNLAVYFDEFLACWLSTKSPRTRKLYRWSVEHFQKFLEREPLLADLNDATVSTFLAYLASGRKPRTANLGRDKLLCFWRWCCRRGYLVRWPEVPPVPQPNAIPRGWSMDQIRKLLTAAESHPGSICGVVSSLWWPAYIRVAFDTGERTGAMLALRWDWLDTDAAEIDVPGSVRKAGKSARYGLRPETLAALEKIRSPERKLIFAFDRDPVVFYARWKRICKRAGLPARPPKSLRISFASHLENNGGNATEALQHSSRAVTRKSYLDPSIVKRERACDRLPEL